MRGGGISGFGEEGNRIPDEDGEDIMDEEESFKDDDDEQNEELEDGRELAFFTSSSSFL